MKYGSEPSASSNKGEAWTSKTSSVDTAAVDSLVSLTAGDDKDGVGVDRGDGGFRFEYSFDRISIVSSFSSTRSFNSLTSVSNTRTLSSNESV